MKCFIPAAGFGKRMEEFTQNLPKPLLPVAGIPLIYYALYYAYRLGIQEVAINLHYKSEMILEELKNFHWMTLRFSIEQSDILGTAGGIKTAIEGVWREDEKFLVINPDSIFSWSKDLESIMKSDFEEALLFLLPNPKGEEYTELNLVNGKIFFGGGEYYYPGISVLQKKILNDVKLNTYYDLSTIFRNLSAIGKLDGIVFPGQAIDFGDSEKYRKNQNVEIFTGDELIHFEKFYKENKRYE